VKVLQVYIPLLKTLHLESSLKSTVPSLPAQLYYPGLHNFFKDDMDIFRSLLRSDLYNINELYKMPGSYSTLLHLAVKAGDAPMAKQFLKMGATAQMKDSFQRTPLHYIALTMASDVATLVKQGQSDQLMVQEQPFIAAAASMLNSGQGENCDENMSWAASPALHEMFQFVLRSIDVYEDAFDLHPLSPLAILTIADCVWHLRKTMESDNVQEFPKSSYTQQLESLPFQSRDVHPKKATLLHGLARFLASSHCFWVTYGIRPVHIRPLFKSFAKLVVKKDSSTKNESWVSQLKVPMDDGKTVLAILEHGLKQSTERELVESVVFLKVVVSNVKCLIASGEAEEVTEFVSCH
jgi:hypothetical protein